MKYTPITINKKTKTHKDKGGKEKKYIYYEAVCTVQLAKKSYMVMVRPGRRLRMHC